MSFQYILLVMHLQQSIFTLTVPHGQFCTWKRFFFPLIDKLMCTIHSNKTLDTLVEYVAYYHIL